MNELTVSCPPRPRAPQDKIRRLEAERAGAFENAERLKAQLSSAEAGAAEERERAAAAAAERDAATRAALERLDGEVRSIEMWRVTSGARRFTAEMDPSHLLDGEVH